MVALGALGSCARKPEKVEQVPELTATRESPSASEAGASAIGREKESENSVVKLETNKGNIIIKLYDKQAPRHSKNFIKLIKQGFYDGIVWHRVVPGFVVQAGDPITKKNPHDPRVGTGGPGYTIPAEIGMKHKRGVVAMARRGDEVNPMRESSGSQFYICLNTENVAQLDGAYSAFGEVIEGMDVVDRIRQGDVIKKATVLKEATISKEHDKGKGEQ